MGETPSTFVSSQWAGQLEAEEQQTHSLDAKGGLRPQCKEVVVCLGGEPHPRRLGTEGDEGAIVEQ